MRSLRQRCEANDKESRLSCSIFQFSIGDAVVCMMQYAKVRWLCRAFQTKGSITIDGVSKSELII